MSQPLQSINLVAPAFKGVNTEDSPIAQDPSFADIADNAVIDKRGRIASRKGLSLLTVDKTELGDDYVHRVHYFYDDLGNSAVFSAGNLKILQGTSDLTDVTPSAYSIVSNNWKIVNFNDEAYFFQRGHDPLVYSHDKGLRSFTEENGVATDEKLKCNEVLPAYGRLWVADNKDSRQTVYWSDLLMGTTFTGGSSGSIDISKAWPDGFDEIVAIAAHNDMLVIFGAHSILVYTGASSPANMKLSDTIAGLGCIDRNTVQHIGTDVLFMSESGLRSFGRTKTEKSLPITDLSLNVKTELIETISNHNGPLDTVYSPEHSFYLVVFPDESLVFCFDLKGVLENNSYRATRWPTVSHKSFERSRDGIVYIGTQEGLNTYSGYLDNTASYRFRYYSPALTFGDPSKLKMLKKIRPTIVGAGGSTVYMKWAYDFSTLYKNVTFTIDNTETHYYNDQDSLFGDATYSSGVVTTRNAVNGAGSGSVVTIGLEADITGSALSLQEINVLALMGKTV